MSESAENMQVTEVEGQEVETKDEIPQEIREAFESGQEEDKEENAIYIDMLQAGCEFSKVRSIYNKLMVEAGLALSKEDKEEILSDVFEKFNVETEDGFDAAVAAVSEEAEFIDEKLATGMVRAYARKNEINYFKKPKGRTGRNSFIKMFYSALIDNPRMNEEEARKFIKENGNDSAIKAEKQHQKVRELANRLYSQYVNV